LLFVLNSSQAARNHQAKLEKERGAIKECEDMIASGFFWCLSLEFGLSTHLYFSWDWHWGGKGRQHEPGIYHVNEVLKNLRTSAAATRHFNSEKTRTWNCNSVYIFPIICFKLLIWKSRSCEAKVSVKSDTLFRVNEELLVRLSLVSFIEIWSLQSKNFSKEEMQYVISTCISYVTSLLGALLCNRLSR
jgi:hypothetical protein